MERSSLVVLVCILSFWILDARACLIIIFCKKKQTGNAFLPPPWFVKDLPDDRKLDGELFGGRKKFQRTISIVKSGPSDRFFSLSFHGEYDYHFLIFFCSWNLVKFHVFDIPSSAHLPFEGLLKQDLKSSFLSQNNLPPQ